MAIKDYMKHGLALLLISGTALGAGSEYYDHTTFPAQGSAATSAGMRAELDAVEDGFDKLPALTGNGGKVVRINSGATAQEAVTQATVVGEAIDGATDKATPVDADEIGLVDSAASNVLKSLTWANLKATIKSYYDAVASTLTNKTINLASNTLTGTTAQFNTALSDGDFATLAGTETLTGKTINLTSNTLVATSAQLATAVTDETGSGALVFGTSPTISSPTVTSPTISGGTINNAAIGGTTRAAGAFTTLSSTGSATLGDAGADTHTINGLATALITSAGAATTPLSIKNNSITANTEVIFDLNPSDQAAGVRSAQISAVNNGSNAITLNFKTSIGNVPATRFSIGATGDATFTGDLTVSGNNIVSANIGPASGQQHALPAVTSDTVALLNATQTLTGKSLSNAVSVRVGTTSAGSGSSVVRIVESGGRNIELATVDTDATNQVGNISLSRYTNSETPFALIRGVSGATYDIVTIGGGGAGYANATQVDIYTGSRSATGATGTKRLSVDPSGNVKVVSAALLGYGTGAGGTVTQATSKATAVTLNKPVGQITTNNAALDGVSSEVFTWNNSLVSTTSIVVCNVSGNANHRAAAESVDAGTVLIRITNTTALSKSEAVNINCAVLSGATS